MAFIHAKYTKSHNSKEKKSFGVIIFQGSWKWSKESWNVIGKGFTVMLNWFRHQVVYSNVFELQGWLMRRLYCRPWYLPLLVIITWQVQWPLQPTTWLSTLRSKRNCKQRSTELFPGRLRKDLFSADISSLPSEKRSNSPPSVSTDLWEAGADQVPGHGDHGGVEAVPDR